MTARQGRNRQVGQKIKIETGTGRMWTGMGRMGQDGMGTGRMWPEKRGTEDKTETDRSETGRMKLRTEQDGARTEQGKGQGQAR